MKAVLFDIGGVVMATHFDRLYANFAERVGVQPSFISGYHEEHWIDMIEGRVTAEQFFGAVRAESGDRAGTVDELRSAWIEEAVKLRTVNAELLRWIDENRGRYTMCALTNLTFPRMIVDEYEDLYSHFDVTVLSCVDHLSKPGPEIFNLALERSGIGAEEAAFVDDGQANVEAAGRLGIRGILYVDNGNLFSELNKLI